MASNVWTVSGEHCGVSVFQRARSTGLYARKCQIPAQGRPQTRTHDHVHTAVSVCVSAGFCMPSIRQQASVPHQACDIAQGHCASKHEFEAQAMRSTAHAVMITAIWAVSGLMLELALWLGRQVIVTGQRGVDAALYTCGGVDVVV